MTASLDRLARVGASALLGSAVGWALLLVLVPAASAFAPDEGSLGSVRRVMHAAAGLVCHQRPERTFAFAGIPWAVCGRCAGIYLGAAVGGAWAFTAGWGAGHTRAAAWRWRFGLALAPSAALWLAEHVLGLGISNVARALGAAPLGWLAAAVVAAVARGHLR